MEEVAGARAFASGAAAYDAYMGRYAVRLAPRFAAFGGVTGGQRVLDVGCGTGALTVELARIAGAESVAGCDPSPALLAACRDRLPDADLREGRAEVLPFDDDAFDTALAQLVFHFVSDPERAARELRRVVRPGGRVALCVWDFEGGMELFRAFWGAVVALDPDAPNELRDMRFGRPGELRELLAGAGLTDVEEELITVEREYADFGELWSTLLLGIGPAGAHVVSLADPERARLREELFERLGSPGGTFALKATARAATATVP